MGLFDLFLDLFTKERSKTPGEFISDVFTKGEFKTTKREFDLKRTATTVVVTGTAVKAGVELHNEKVKSDIERINSEIDKETSDI
jgi:hypothetical protein